VGVGITARVGVGIAAGTCIDLAVGVGVGAVCPYFIVVLRRVGGERKGEQATHAQDDEQQGDGYE
jgi:hypothetical protein